MSAIDLLREDYANDRITIEEFETAVERELRKPKGCHSRQHHWLDITQFGGEGHEICSRCGISRAAVPSPTFVTVLL